MEEDKKIEEFLKSEGWLLENDVFSKTIQKESNTVAIINGQRVQQPPVTINCKIKYFGIGYIDDTPIYEYSIYTEKEINTNTICVYDLEEFKNEIYNRIK